MVRAKLQDDFENEIKECREYDLANEKIKIGTDKIDPNAKYIVLANHKGQKQETTKDDEKVNAESAEPIFVYTVPYANVLDPVRYFQTKLKRRQAFTLTIDEPKQDLPFDVVFENRAKPIFFELDEIPKDQIPQSHLDRMSKPSSKDNLLKSYYSYLRGQKDFDYGTRGIRRDVDQEFLFVGGL